MRGRERRRRERESVCESERRTMTPQYKCINVLNMLTLAKLRPILNRLYLSHSFSNTYVSKAEAHH
jgi:hypothetical protein